MLLASSEFIISAACLGPGTWGGLFIIMIAFGA